MALTITRRIGEVFVLHWRRARVEVHVLHTFRRSDRDPHSVMLRVVADCNVRISPGPDEHRYTDRLQVPLDECEYMVIQHSNIRARVKAARVKANEVKIAIRAPGVRVVRLEVEDEEG